MGSRCVAHVTDLIELKNGNRSEHLKRIFQLQLLRVYFLQKSEVELTTINVRSDSMNTFPISS